MPGFLDGARSFRSSMSDDLAARLRNLADGQSPDALFITCSDSRIDPNLITRTAPGELFVVRNAGNIVPPAGSFDGASAAIEYAVAALRVPHVVVCGHSGCGAIGALLDPSAADGLPLVQQWVDHATDAVDGDDGLDPIERNVVVQLDHLRSLPAVADRLAAGDLTLHGWVFDIGSGSIRALDDAGTAFAPIDA